MLELETKAKEVLEGQLAEAATVREELTRSKAELHNMELSADALIAEVAQLQVRRKRIATSHRTVARAHRVDGLRSLVCRHSSRQRPRRRSG